MKKTAINEIFVEIGISVREGKVMATGSKRGSSADVTLWWRKVMQLNINCNHTDDVCSCQLNLLK